MLAFRGGPSRAIAVLGCTLLACFSIPPSARAQRPAGEVRIEVKDPSGAAVSASGKLENLSTGNVRSFQTDTQGAHAFTGLAYGRYRLEVTASGFAAQTVLLDVHSTEPVTRTVTLSLSAQAFQVDVVGATPLAGTDLSPDGDSPAGAGRQPARHREQRRPGPLRLPEQAPQRRPRQRNAGQSLPARRRTIAATPPRRCSARRRASRSTWTESGSISRSATW